MKKVFAFLLILFLIGCRPDANEDTLIHSDVAVLHDFLSTFELEAASRGFRINLDELDIDVVIEEIDDDNVAGTCQYSPNRPNLVTIDRSFWDSASDIWREMVVFHELGHCVLGRGHREDMDENGSCLSIIQSGLGTCILRYNQVNRDYYIDELFFPGSF